MNSPPEHNFHTCPCDNCRAMLRLYRECRAAIEEALRPHRGAIRRSEVMAAEDYAVRVTI